MKEKNVLQKYLDQNNISKYKIFKTTGIPQTTLSHATADNKKLSGQTVKVISAVAATLHKTPGKVLDELIEIEKDTKK